LALYESVASGILALRPDARGASISSCAILFKRRYRKQLGNVLAIGILSGDFFLVENAVESGRFLLRFGLR
jgi:hypothetical protein